MTLPSAQQPCADHTTAALLTWSDGLTAFWTNAEVPCVCILQIWRQMESGQAGSRQGSSQQMSEACQRLPAELRSILTPESARDTSACWAEGARQGPAVLIVAEPSAKLSASELKWAGMIARKVESCLSPRLQT